MEKAKLLQSEIAADFSNYTATKDFRANGYPCDEKGKPLYTSDSKEDYISYIDWLADYIVTVDLEPIQEQLALCEIKYDSHYSGSAHNSVDHLRLILYTVPENEGAATRKRETLKRNFGRDASGRCLLM